MNAFAGDGVNDESRGSDVFCRDCVMEECSRNDAFIGDSVEDECSKNFVVNASEFNMQVERTSHKCSSTVLLSILFKQDLKAGSTQSNTAEFNASS